MNYQNHNLAFLAQLERLIEGIGYGTLDVSVDLHNKKVFQVTMYGKERRVYENEEVEVALKDVLKRIKQSLEGNKTETVTFSIKTKKGKVTEVLWMNDTTIPINVN